MGRLHPWTLRLAAYALRAWCTIRWMIRPVALCTTSMLLHVHQPVDNLWRSLTALVIPGGYVRTPLPWSFGVLGSVASLWSFGDLGRTASAISVECFGVLGMRDTLFARKTKGLDDPPRRTFLDEADPRIFPSTKALWKTRAKCHRRPLVSSGGRLTAPPCGPYRALKPGANRAGTKLQLSAPLLHGAKHVGTPNEHCDLGIRRG